ncbi:hypothetical protein [Spirosoma sordidisoli]|uniref:Uncharacterized protein n=1 Tax=Spirosoma sordidisoli TaxID=2502893 RepID=A0A4Q2USW2_9BACT|nr:hypothetical protein [Spirosoma sordidisoli]RYC70875.1 hypothetical protein EQG79_01605 [Spirosoma sordidisoli]
MAFTLEDINALTDEQITPEMEAALMGKIENRAITYLTGKGHVVKPKTEYDTEFNTALSTKQKEWADSEAPKFYGAMDKMLAAVGLAKPDGMKTREYVEKLSAEGKLPFTAEQITKIEAMLKGDGGGSTAEKALLNQLKKEFDDYKQSIEDGKKGEFAKTVTRLVDSSLKTAPVNIDPALKTDAEKATARKGAVSDLTALFNSLYEGAEDANGVLGFKKKGTADFLMNTATGEPMTPLEIIQKNHSLFLAPTGHQQQGGGTGGSGGSGGGKPSTKQEIYKAASDAGLRMYSDDWKKFVAEKEAELKK